MIRLRVHAGPYPRRFCPVSVLLNLDPSLRVTLYQLPRGKPRACQLVAEGGGSRLHWMVTRLEADATSDYEVVLTPERRRPVPRLVWETVSPGVQRLTLDGASLVDWRDAPDASSGLQAIVGPGNLRVIDRFRCSAQLVSRVHQVTTCDTESTIEGVTLAQLRTRGWWQDATGFPIVEEAMTYTCYATPAELRLMDVTARLTASVGPVSFDPRSHGLLHLDLPAAISHGDTTNSVGAKGGDACDAPAVWFWLATERGGLALFDHPTNPGHPCHWRLGATLSADPFVAVARFQPAFTLPTGEILEYRYRLCLLGADVRRSAVVGHYLNYAYPPRVEVLAEPRS